VLWDHEAIAATQDYTGVNVALRTRKREISARADIFLGRTLFDRLVRDLLFLNVMRIPAVQRRWIAERITVTCHLPTGSVGWGSFKFPATPDLWPRFTSRQSRPGCILPVVSGRHTDHSERAGASVLGSLVFRRR
jgi:hypothetical protein